jgi:hypothetical protein
MASVLYLLGVYDQLGAIVGRHRVAQQPPLDRHDAEGLRVILSVVEPLSERAVLGHRSRVRAEEKAYKYETRRGHDDETAPGAETDGGKTSAPRQRAHPEEHPRWNRTGGQSPANRGAGEKRERGNGRRVTHRDQRLQCRRRTRPVDTSTASPLGIAERETDVQGEPRRKQDDASA